MASAAILEARSGTTLGDRVHGKLRERLMAGEYAPGEKLSLRSVAEELGVSMTPVREAVSRLVADQALEVAPNKAVRVPLMNVRRFRELMALRIDIEGLAAARAAQARDEDDIMAIAASDNAFRLEALKPRPNAAKAVAINQKLHFAIYRAAKSDMLVDVIAGLWLKMGPIINLDLRENPERLKSGGAMNFHGAALAAIRKKDGEAARQAITGDIQGAGEFIIARGRLPK
jgi:DNA-binding GntR family transcriptional regulator